jgi:hypothetical protein
LSLSFLHRIHSILYSSKYPRSSFLLSLCTFLRRKHRASPFAPRGSSETRAPHIALFGTKRVCYGSHCSVSYIWWERRVNTRFWSSTGGTFHIESNHDLF